jgi:hypothetical protein
MKKWEEWELKLIEDILPTQSYSKVQELLPHRTIMSIKKKAKRLGIFLTEETYNKSKAQNKGKILTEEWRNNLSRSHQKEDILRYDRKSNTCPKCGKKILKVSKFCNSCSQKGENNNNFVNGLACRSRICSKCGEKISTGSKKGLCRTCYTKTLSEGHGPNYKNGRYIREFYNKEEYSKWRQQIYKRDKYTCQECGYSERGKLDAHHIHSKGEYPELAYEIDNGITLCKICHQKTYGKELLFSEKYNQMIAELKFRELGGPCNVSIYTPGIPNQAT